MKYGRLELQARLAFLFTFLYTSSYPEASEKQNKKPNQKNNQIKQNKIKLSIEWWSSWPQREKGKCSFTLPLLTSSALPRWRVLMDGLEDLASGFWPAAQKVGAWTQLGRGIRWERRERNSFPRERLEEDWRGGHRSGAERVPLHQKPLENSHPLPQHVLAGVQGRQLPRKPKVGKRKAQLGWGLLQAGSAQSRRRPFKSSGCCSRSGHPRQSRSSPLRKI